MLPASLLPRDCHRDSPHSRRFRRKPMSTKTNPRLNDLIAELKSTSRETDADVWRDIADRLEKPRSSHAEVNLGRIERYAREDETVVVPGKVLGSGALQKNVTVAAVDFSSSAETKIDQVGETVPLERLLEENPEGSDVRVIA
ncbi:50S ribosomal protein L18e [Salinilacihabitans rarus]|uniref:50S ribosomal protein L18e n=1 Tax=Salinilacihabitans rarus TaxID=2961596 RepID=UPI002113966C|nr:50S ribosomal protein L18e [Salinilacihabitans rarus]